eukprot:scaffold471964_cov19-Prasinocladus_malaysianus.AAC.1
MWQWSGSLTAHLHSSLVYTYQCFDQRGSGYKNLTLSIAFRRTRTRMYDLSAVVALGVYCKVKHERPKGKELGNHCLNLAELNDLCQKYRNTLQYGRIVNFTGPQVEKGWHIKSGLHRGVPHPPTSRL